MSIHYFLPRIESWYSTITLNNSSKRFFHFPQASSILLRTFQLLFNTPHSNSPILQTGPHSHILTFGFGVPGCRMDRNGIGVHVPEHSSMQGMTRSRYIEEGRGSIEKYQRRVSSGRKTRRRRTSTDRCVMVCCLGFLFLRAYIDRRVLYN